MFQPSGSRTIIDAVTPPLCSLGLGLSLIPGLVMSLDCLVKLLENIWTYRNRSSILSYLMFVPALVTFLACSSKERNALLFSLLWPRFGLSTLTLTSALASLFGISLPWQGLSKKHLVLALLPLVGVWLAWLH